MGVFVANSAENRGLVVDGVLFRGKKILLGKRPRSKSFLPGYWELPGGHVEANETPEIALKREFMEELQVKIDVLRQIHEFSFFYSGIRKRLLVFLVKQTDSAEPKPLDHDELRWVLEEEIASMHVSSDERTAILIGFKEISKI